VVAVPTGIAPSKKSTFATVPSASAAVALTVMVLWIGLYPAPFLNMINGSVQALVDRVQQGSVMKAARP